MVKRDQGKEEHPSYWAFKFFKDVLGLYVCLTTVGLSLYLLGLPMMAHFVIGYGHVPWVFLTAPGHVKGWYVGSSHMGVCL